MKGKIKAGDIVIVCGVLLLSLTVFCVSLFSGFSGDSEILVISCDGGDKTLSLKEDTELTVKSMGYTLTIKIKDGKAYVESADCSDNTCVHTGKIDRSGQVIACVPAGVMLRITGEEADYDFVAG